MNTPAADKLVLDTANSLKQAFTLARRDYDSRITRKPSTWGAKHYARWDGGQADDGRYYKSVWIAIASQCVSDGYDPARLVRVLFEDTKLSMAPVPTMLMSQRNIDRYIKSSSKHADELRVMKETQDIAFRNACSINRALYQDDLVAATTAINDVSQPLSALYRCCVAAVAGDERVYARFELQAVVEYTLRQNSYDDAWGSFIPAAMKRAAKKMRSKAQDYAINTTSR